MRAGDAAPKYLDQFNSKSVFRLAPFDVRAAVEVAAMTRGAIDTTGNKRGKQDGIWAKIKYDRQIIAIAKVNGSALIYSDDKEIFKFGQEQGLTVIRIADIPLPPVEPQMEMNLPAGDKDGGDL